MSPFIFRSWELDDIYGNGRGFFYIHAVMASVKMILFSYSNEDTKDEERRKGWVVERRLNGVPSAKPTPCPRTTPQHMLNTRLVLALAHFH
jgi:hypothetical protein